MDIFKAIMMTIFQILGFIATIFAGVCGVLFICEHPGVIAGIIVSLVGAAIAFCMFMENLEKIKHKHND